MNTTFREIDIKNQEEKTEKSYTKYSGIQLYIKKYRNNKSISDEDLTVDIIKLLDRIE